jgi:hypothetical protein
MNFVMSDTFARAFDRLASKDKATAAEAAGCKTYLLSDDSDDGDGVHSAQCTEPKGWN